MPCAFVQEVFASVQGEGVAIGQRHIFVRFLGCDQKCRYCDTPGASGQVPETVAPPCSAQRSPDSFDRETVPNPVNAGELTRLCDRLVIPSPARATISLTGGEPLLQAEFLKAWLPTVRERYAIHLETAGVHPDALRELSGIVDHVSMDIKLSSATGQKARWSEHREFLHEVSSGFSVKVVVAAGTTSEEITAAARLLADSGRSVPFIIQPCSGSMHPSPGELMTFQSAALAILPDVRVIPQVHKVLNVP